jgi:hypothetical protein
MTEPKDVPRPPADDELPVDDLDAVTGGFDTLEIVDPNASGKAIPFT